MLEGTLVIKILSEVEQLVLVRALGMARRRYEEHAEAMGKCAASGGNELIRVEAAKAMEEDHKETARSFEELRLVLVAADEVRVIGEDLYKVEED
jgi:hypothetical protein